MTLQVSCPACGAALVAGAGFCGSCGARVYTGSVGVSSVAANDEYAGFWIRPVSAFVDGIILNIIGYSLGLVRGDGGGGPLA